MLSIANEVDLLIFRCVYLVCDTNMYFSNKWYQSGLHFQICIIRFMSFGIRDSNFMMLEDSTFNFQHGCWNYCFIKTDIDVMMYFKFNIKYDKLNFKTIASMEFSFDLKLNLFYSYDGCLFMKNRWKLLQKNSGKFKFHEFRSIENYFQPNKWNNDQYVWFDWYLITSQSIEQRSSTNRARQIVKYEFF